MAALEQAAQQEPALRDEAARLLLGLASHAQLRIRRSAVSPKAPGLPLVSDDDGASYDSRLEAFRWRLRAIEALAQAEGGRRACCCSGSPPELQFVLEACS